MATRRQYTEDEKASALTLLKAHAGNFTRTAAELGIPASTLRKWHAGLGVNRAVADKCEGKKEELDALFERVARLYLGRAMDAGAVTASSGKDAVITAATAVDKMRLLRDQPTSITGRELTDAERLDGLRELAERGRARRLGIPDAPGAAAVGQPRLLPVRELG